MEGQSKTCNENAFFQNIHWHGFYQPMKIFFLLHSCFLPVFFSLTFNPFREKLFDTNWLHSFNAFCANVTSLIPIIYFPTFWVGVTSFFFICSIQKCSPVNLLLHWEKLRLRHLFLADLTLLANAPVPGLSYYYLEYICSYQVVP